VSCQPHQHTNETRLPCKSCKCGLGILGLYILHSSAL
jgi:hypothetical protein